MNLLDTLTRAADEEQLRLKPLPLHAAAKQAEHLRRHYALLLAAMLTSQPTISEPQTRLLRLLLDTLELGDIRGALFENARALEPATLLEAARLIREAGFAHHLVVDTLVLLRLDAPLSDETSRLVGELAAFLGLDEDALVMRADDAAEILGLDEKEVDGENAPVGNDEDDEAADAGSSPALLARYWPSRLRQPLTAEALRNGLQGGLWLLEDNLDVDFPWQANDAILVFRNGATLNTFAKEGEIKLANCRLVDAALDFQGACSITLERCDWQGDYDPAIKRTALNSIGPTLTVTGCQFSTRNARAIAVHGNALTLTESRFTRCGHAELDGGAIWHSFDASRVIENCRFDSCLAARGGALWVNKLYGISKCEFIDCASRALQDKRAGDVAVYSGCAAGCTVVSKCVFRRTSLVIGSAYSGSNVEFVCSTQFQQGNLYYYNRYSSNRITNACQFERGREIELEL